MNSWCCHFLLFIVAYVLQRSINISFVIKECCPITCTWMACVCNHCRTLFMLHFYFIIDLRVLLLGKTITCVSTNPTDSNSVSLPQSLIGHFWTSTITIRMYIFSVEPTFVAKINFENEIFYHVNGSILVFLALSIGINDLTLKIVV